MKAFDNQYGTHTLQFDSITEAGEFARKTPRVAGSEDHSASNMPSRHWDLGLGLDNALTMAEDGGLWPEGATKMRDSLDVIAKHVRSHPRPQLESAVIGGAVSVPTYLAGAPKHMLRTPPRPHITKPVIRFGVSIIQSAGSDGSERVNMGAAILTAVDMLERQGYSCEITAYWFTYWNPELPAKDWVNCEFMVKRQGQKYNPVACAFALAHPAAGRRLCFKILETQPRWKDVVDHSYGRIASTKERDVMLAERYEVIVDQFHKEQAYKTPEGAFDAIQAKVQTALDKLAKDAA